METKDSYDYQYLNRSESLVSYIVPTSTIWNWRFKKIIYRYSIMAARRARLALADSRALEEEAERVNPVGAMSGSGATPSMGLSQFRGGGKGECEDSSSGEEMVGSGHVVGAGKKRGGRTRKGKGTLKITHEGAGKPCDDEAYGMGRHLGQHLHKLHGAGFWDSFKSGFDSVMKVAAPIAKVALPMVAPGLGTAATLGLSALGYGTKKGMMRKTARKAYEGGAHEPPVEPFEIAENSGKYEGKGFTGQGKGGRSHRAALVKKLMAEEGLSMIEASKAVKARGLY